MPSSSAAHRPPASRSEAVTTTHDIVSLVTSSGNTIVYPSDDQIVAILQARFRADHVYTWLGATTLVTVNPLRTLRNRSDEDAQHYMDRCYADTAWEGEGRPHPSEALSPHPFELALRLYLAMRRTKSSQAVVLSGVTNSGKTYTSHLITRQLLRVSAHLSNSESKLASQVEAADVVIEAFGCAKTAQSGNASRIGKYTELHFNLNGRLKAAKLLAFGLEKARVGRTLEPEERTFHVFYQLLAGSSVEERESLHLDDVTAYNLLTSSGCYRAPSGPGADDVNSMEELRSAFKTLGFKPKQVWGVWTILSAILLLSNIEFREASSGDPANEGAVVSNPHTLQTAAELLGLEPEDLYQCLTTRTRLFQKQVVSTLLGPRNAEAQRDSLAENLYATLFAFVVETANFRLMRGLEDIPLHQKLTKIVQLDVAGNQLGKRTSMQAGEAPKRPVDQSMPFSSHHVFVANFVAEFVQNYIFRRVFDDEHSANAALRLDGVELAEVVTGDNTGCIELLRGSASIGGSTGLDRKPGGVLGTINDVVGQVHIGSVREEDGRSLLAPLDRFATHSSYIASNHFDKRAFGINHFQGPTVYDVGSFLRDEHDSFDATFVELLRHSQVQFIARLMSGPGLAIEPHPMDPAVAGATQVSVRPLRQPTSLNDRNELPSPVLDPSRPYGVSRQVNATISEILAAVSGAGTVWTVLSLRPNDIDQPNSYDVRRVKSQVRALLLPDMPVRKRFEYFCDYSYDDFCIDYAMAGLTHAAAAARVTEPREKVQAFFIANAFRDKTDYALGHARVWLSHAVWRRLQDRLRNSEVLEDLATRPAFVRTQPIETEIANRGTPQTPLSELPSARSPQSPGAMQIAPEEDKSLLLRHAQVSRTLSADPFRSPMDISPPDVDAPDTEAHQNGIGPHDTLVEAPSKQPVRKNSGPMIDLLEKGTTRGADYGDMGAIEEEPTSSLRRWWVRFVWWCTFWIPSKFLSAIGEMKRPDVQMAWREKVTICWLIFLSCAFILFYILLLGHVICPENNKAWNTNQLSGHNTPESFYVAIRGKVYDLQKFWKLQHSDTGLPVTNDLMLQVAGQDLTPYFPVPLTIGCPGLVTDTGIALSTNASSNYYTPTIEQAMHVSGPAGNQASILSDIDWYPNTFLPRMRRFYKGYFVTSRKDVAKFGNDRQWAIVDDSIYDLGDYLYTNSLNNNDKTTSFLPKTITDIFGSQAGSDISGDFNREMMLLPLDVRQQVKVCLDNVFYAGRPDFRDTPRCVTQNYLLLAFSIVLVTTIAAKFLAALQLTSKGNPEQQDKFVICQVPCYTEGEEELRKTIDSLAGLMYDDKRKLLFIICDGMIVGNGNEQSTPRIVLDILGVDPKIDPEPLMFKSVAEGSKQLNYGKVYSGLYEFEGHVVPYIVVIKVGRPSERNRPGNRGKRDTQIMLMRYLNRVHFDAPMYPLELEVYHQMKNVIGIDPAFYEYILMVDADTTVDPEGLNRLVSVAADDSRVIAVCGETRVVNEEGSWWTMIQVYEYYISHHLAKAFESLFGSVTCLPGCFSMYRVRSADKGRPLFISNRIIDDYSDNRVDTLHKKNLLSLGEDRYLTTLILKHFPSFGTKFTPDARAQTTAPDKWGILLSQRRRWINSTIHNLAELVMMPELCGFCCFSMRFIVLIDLLGTIILPATTVYLVYLIIQVATTKTQIPYISLAMIGAVYGLQMVIFLVKRQWQYLGWLLIYLLAYPVWSFFLPIYSFWHMDDFSWGNTRIVVGEKGNKKIIAGTDDEPFNDDMLPLKKFSEYQRDVWLPHSSGSGRTSPSVMMGGGSPGSDSGSAHRGHARKHNSADYYRNTNVLERTSQSSHRASLAQKQGMPMMGHGASLPPNMRASSYSMYPQSPMMSMYAPSMYGMPAVPMPSLYGITAPSVWSANNSVVGMGGPGMGYSHSYSNPGSEVGIPNPFGNTHAVGAQRLAPQTTGGSWNSLPGYGHMQPGTGQSSRTPSMLMNPGNPFAVAGSEGTHGRLTAASGLAVSLKATVTDEDLLHAVQTYLAIQPDLMQVSKRSAREAVIAAFPNAPDVPSRKARINQAIDDTLRGAA